MLFWGLILRIGKIIWGLKNLSGSKTTADYLGSLKKLI